MPARTAGVGHLVPPQTSASRPVHTATPRATPPRGEPGNRTQRSATGSQAAPLPGPKAVSASPRPTPVPFQTSRAAPVHTIAAPPRAGCPAAGGSSARRSPAGRRPIGRSHPGSPFLWPAPCRSASPPASRGSANRSTPAAACLSTPGADRSANLAGRGLGGRRRPLSRSGSLGALAASTVCWSVRTAGSPPMTSTLPTSPHRRGVGACRQRRRGQRPPGPPFGVIGSSVAGDVQAVGTLAEVVVAAPHDQLSSGPGGSHPGPGCQRRRWQLPPDAAGGVVGGSVSVDDRAVRPGLATHTSSSRPVHTPTGASRAGLAGRRAACGRAGVSGHLCHRAPSGRRLGRGLLRLTRSRAARRVAGPRCRAPP
jgi:hypothetical protein